MKAFVDSDIVLDLLLKRAPFHNESEAFFNKIAAGGIKGFTTPLGLSNVYYLIHDVYKVKNSKGIIKNIRLVLGVLPMDDFCIDSALASGMRDLEDAIQYYCCLQNKMDHIVTRNKKDYKGSKIPVSTAGELLDIYKGRA